MRQYLALPLPPKELHPNSRAAWQQKWLGRWGRLSPKAEYRETVKWMTVEALQGGLRPPPDPAHLHLAFRFTTKRKRDVDNCLSAFKNGLDGLVIGGLIPSDESDHLRAISIEVVKGASEDEVLVSWEAE